MNDRASMSDDEIRTYLKFSPEWFALGVIDEAAFRQTVRSFREADEYPDFNDEHWRYGAFIYFMERHPVLTPEQCEGLFELGADDPDFSMGQSMMLQVLDRPECLDLLRSRAAAHPRTRRYFGTW